MPNYLVMEALMKREAQYGWAPWTNQFGWAEYYFENIFYLFYKTSYANEEVNCNGLSPQLVFLI